MSGITLQRTRRVGLTATWFMALGLNSLANAQAAGDFVDGENSDLVTATCTRCHSASLVTQNSGSRDVWQLRVNLMQSAHGMPAIDAAMQEAIVGYLATYYGQKAAARRAALAPEFLPDNPYDAAD